MNIVNVAGVFLILLVTICSAFHPYISKESKEIVSKEHGQKPGSKSTNCRCGWTNKGFNRIVGGVQTKVNEYPYMVAVGKRRPLTIYCGGTIVTPSHVLTAAHCVEDKSVFNMMVMVGEHDLTTWDETNATNVINVKAQRVHLKYNPTTKVNDIALLILQQKITFTDLVGPACLPNGAINLVDQYVKILGWGLTSNNGHNSEYLRQINIRVIPLKYCAQSYRVPISTSNPTQYCTYSKGKDSCTGDSGGPNIWLDPETNMYTVVGVVSFGADCAYHIPGVNVDVTRYVEWIDKNIGDTDSSVETCKKI